MASNEDHYLWLTALLSSHHLERATCWLIAATTFLLGVVPVILVADHPGPHWRVSVASVIAVCASAIAMLWATRCWPTRGQSRASAMVAAVCVAAAAMVVPDPLVAAIGALAFAGPAVFSALFHTRRLLLFTWGVGALTLVPAAWRLAAADAPLAAAVIPMIVVVNFFAVFAWSLVVHLIEDKVSSALLDPVTGLYNRAGFDERTAAILGARDRAHDRHLVVVVTYVDTYGLLMSLNEGARAERAVITAARQLRGTVRRDTVLAYRGDGDFLLAELFTTADPSVLLERLRGTLADRPAQLSASIGAVSTPLAPLAQHPVNDVLDELLPLYRSVPYSFGECTCAARHMGAITP